MGVYAILACSYNIAVSEDNAFRIACTSRRIHVARDIFACWLHSFLWILLAEFQQFVKG